MNDAEAAVIGCMMLDTKNETVYQKIDERMFAEEPLAAIFKACRLLHKKGIPADAVTVISTLGDDYKLLVMQCAQTAPAASRIGYYADCVLEAWRIRTIQQEAAEVAVSNETADELCGRLSKALAYQQKVQAALENGYSKTFVHGCSEFLTALEKPDTSIKTGWSLFDKITGGMQRQSVCVIAGRPGKGKTDWSLQMATKLSQKANVLYCSMEMTTEQLMQRVVSRAARINSIKIRDKDLTPEELESIGAVLETMTKVSNLTFDETPEISTDAVEEKIGRFKPDIVFLDHLMLMNKGNKKNQWEGVADNTHRLKSMAMKYNICIVELAQLNRETDHRKPTMADLYGGSAVEQDADAIYMLNVPEMDHFLEGDESVEIKIEIPKNRHGNTGELEFAWQPQYHNYREIQREG